MTVLVLGATGNVGSAVTERLLAGGAKVAALTRSADKAKTLPKGVEARIGDLTDAYGVAGAFKGAEAVFVLNALSQTELQEGLIALEHARRHGAKKVVYLSVQYAERGPHIPHFAGKIVIEQAIKASGIPYTILQPNNFYQNDAWFKDAILAYGVYPQPIGPTGIDRVDVRDIADAGAAALTSDTAKNTTIILGGPDSWTGEKTAEAWSRHVGKPIKYGGDDLEAWSAQAKQMMPAWLVFDLAMMYHSFQQNGLKATAKEKAAAEALMGHPLRGYEDYVQETAAAWGVAKT